MRFIECVQGTEEWFDARCGLITASMFSTICEEIGGLNEQQKKYVSLVHSGINEKDASIEAGYKAKPSSTLIQKALIGEKTTDYSDSAKRYASDLSIERISKKMYGIPPKAWILNRGHEMESHARRLYEAQTGYFVTEAGICVDDDRIGYSTDGLVESEGLIEIKAPIDSIKIETMMRTGDISEYVHQIQGGMWLTGRSWCDFIMYVPDLESVGNDLYVKRIIRDDDFIDEIINKIFEFSKLIDKKEQFFRFNKAA